MSGLAFQKMNGQGTQMQTLIDEVKKNNKSDLYKTAVEYCVGKTLTPVAKSWEIYLTEERIVNLNFEGLYFGKFQIQHNSVDTANNDNGYKRSICKLVHNGSTVAETRINIHGDDILTWGTEKAEHTGFANSMQLATYATDQQPVHSAIISFIGYKLTSIEGFIYPTPTVIQNINNDGNVHLNTSDLTALGYTYHWSEKDNNGSWINPNTPNAIFVPNGNGHYVLVLVVKDGNVTSTPVEIPVQINYGSFKVQIIDNTIIKLNNGLTLQPFEIKDFYYAYGTTPGLKTVLDYNKGVEISIFRNGELYQNGAVMEQFSFNNQILENLSYIYKLKNWEVNEYVSLKNELDVNIQVKTLINTIDLSPLANIPMYLRREITVISPVSFSVFIEQELLNISEFINGYYYATFYTGNSNTTTFIKAS